MAEQAGGAVVARHQAPDDRVHFWRSVLAEWSSSGQTKAPFCKARGVSSSAFHWWKAELARRDAAAKRSSRAVGPVGRVKGGQLPGFVAVRVAGGLGLERLCRCGRTARSRVRWR